MKNVTFVPRHVAEKIARQYDFTISIASPGEPAAISGPRLLLEFDDVETAEQTGALAFNTEMARSIITTVDSLPEDTLLLVHCEAGMSRSAAVAKWLELYRGYRLILHPQGVGTSRHYNRHVYNTLEASEGCNMAAWYAELERRERGGK